MIKATLDKGDKDTGQGEYTVELVQWNDSFVIGYQEVDEDHQKLVGMLNALNTSISEQDTHEVVGKVLNDLLSYTAWHFRHEERLMQTFRYPDYVAHKKEHGSLIQQATELQTKFLAAEQELTQDVMDFLKRWLVHHILQTDKAMADFLRQKV
ncbi:MAG: hemerythrin family protein [Magnetococcales bacterium]|nr:hemerythrin family protein [Magnetococcales bacterium]